MPDKKVANTKNLRRTHSSCRVQSLSVYDYRTTTVTSNSRITKNPGFVSEQPYNGMPEPSRLKPKMKEKRPDNSPVVDEDEYNTFN